MVLCEVNKCVYKLNPTKEWYIDGTFKSVGAPFTQLWSIHVLIEHGESVKQVPVAFAVMSRASADDYKAVLEHIIKDVPVPQLSNVLMDFELFYPRSLVRTAIFTGLRLFGVNYSH